MKIIPTNNEKTFDSNVLLVTKTDLKGKIIYANRGFMKIVGIDEDVLIGAPHSIIRHPDMPKIIFKYLWEYLQRGDEIHAYVKNICADGSYYWVIANVTPSHKIKRFSGGRRMQASDNEEEEEVVGYHSSRRSPSPQALAIIKPLYENLLQAEKSGGLAASDKIMQDLLKEKGVDYDEFILSF
ncbi:MAG: PAS domain-containing protein [Sulfurimonas sp.]|nr:PAS domain-containing protein [Sulfurimonas sp.]MDQ7061213.1 PAS domain-containing protein [Sulfurimonas sp.]